MTTVRFILRKQLKLSYKKVKPLSLQTNSVRSLASRQAYAVQMLRASANNFRLVNLD